MKLFETNESRRFVFLGDSITADNRFNYISMLTCMLAERTELDRFNIINSGVNSSSVFDAIDRVPELFAENEKIDCLFIFIGINDSKKIHGINKCLVPINIYKEKYNDMIELIKNKSPETEIILMTLPLLSFETIDKSTFLDDYWCWDRDEYSLYNTSIRDLAKFNGLRMIDIYDSFNSIKKELISSYFTFDGVHPNAKGHKLIADKILFTLQ